MSNEIYGDNSHDFNLKMLLIVRDRFYYCPHCQRTFFETPATKGTCWRCRRPQEEDWFWHE